MKLNTIRMECDFSYWDELFTEEELDKIIEYCDSQEQKVAVIGADINSEEVNQNIRKSKIAWIFRNENTEWFFSRIESAANKLNSKFFGFDIERLQSMQYTIYDQDGSHYEWHWDCYTGNNLNTLEDPQQRKLSGVLQLSHSDDYEGGELELSPCGNTKRIEKKRGLSIFFPSFTLHKVNPVTKGQRKTLVAWFTGPDWK